jgi:hypothetical protein
MKHCQLFCSKFVENKYKHNGIWWTVALVAWQILSDKTGTTQKKTEALLDAS